MMETGGVCSLSATTLPNPRAPDSANDPVSSKPEGRLSWEEEGDKRMTRVNMSDYIMHMHKTVIMKPISMCDLYVIKKDDVTNARAHTQSRNAKIMF